MEMNSEGGVWKGVEERIGVSEERRDDYGFGGLSGVADLWQGIAALRTQWQCLK